MMLFSRNRLRLGKAAPKTARPQASEPAQVETEAPSRTVEERPLCTLINDLPEGHYVTLESLELPESFASSMAVLKIDEGRCALVVDQDAFGNQRHVKALHVLRKNYKVAHVRATHDLVRSLHGMNAGESEDADLSDVENLAWEIVDSAVEKGASDIHIETRSNFADVLLRINGVRVVDQTLSTDRAFAVAKSLYNFHADANNKDLMWAPDSVKDTTINRQTRTGKQVQIRFHSAPIAPAGNVQIVCRLLSMDSSAALSLDSLNYLPAQREAIDRMLRGARGLVLLVGPTNSGKTTTIQALLRQIQAYRGQTIKISTVEDPVEYVIPGACQMGVPTGRKSLEGQDGSVMSELLKATLRQDPDVVMLGEIRDEESARTAQNLSLSGRKILATLHAFEGMAAFYRLREIGIPESVLFMPGFLSGVIFQRLVPRVCSHCAVPLHKSNALDEALMARVVNCAGDDLQRVRVRSELGCKHCNGTGIGGRLLCAEVIVPTEEMLDLLIAGRFSEARSLWMGQTDLHVPGVGVPTALGHAIYLLRQGRVDPRDIEAQVDMLDLGTTVMARGGLRSVTA